MIHVTHARALAAAQTIPIRGDVAANIEDHVRLARVAAGARAQVLVFPELSLTGYELDLAGDLAFSEDDPRLAPLLEVASAESITLVAGAPVRLDAKLHIGAFIVFPDRTVEVYTKHHLGAFPPAASVDGIVPPAEDTVFHPGDRNPLVRLGDDLAAVAVCADTGRPSHARAAADRGARSYLASMFVIPSELEHETTRLQDHAAHHSLAVVLANYGGPSGGLRAAGRSAIWSETGKLLAQLDTSGSGVVIAIETRGGWHGRTIRLEPPGPAW